MKNLNKQALNKVENPTPYNGKHQGQGVSSMSEQGRSSCFNDAVPAFPPWSCSLRNSLPKEKI